MIIAWSKNPFQRIFQGRGRRTLEINVNMFSDWTITPFSMVKVLVVQGWLWWMPQWQLPRMVALYLWQFCSRGPCAVKAFVECGILWFPLPWPLWKVVDSLPGRAISGKPPPLSNAVEEISPLFARLLWSEGRICVHPCVQCFSIPFPQQHSFQDPSFI